MGKITEASSARSSSGKVPADVRPATVQTATLGGGCFWCMETVFQRLQGVRSVVSGYAGGTTDGPTYQQVCSGATGHAEVVQIEYDSEVISFEQLLERFWKAHDPTTLNRQGVDVGTQYRSIVLYHNHEQRQTAERSKRKLAASGRFVVTEIKPLGAFFPAEAYHQDYFRKNPDAAYCRMVIQPELRKLGIQD